MQWCDIGERLLDGQIRRVDSCFFQRHLSNQRIIILPICTKWAMYLYSDCMKEIVHRITQ